MDLRATIGIKGLHEIDLDRMGTGAKLQYVLADVLGHTFEVTDLGDTKGVDPQAT